MLALAALPLLSRRALAAGLVVVLAVAVLFALPPGVVKAQAGLIYERESRYQFIQVVQRTGAERGYSTSTRASPCTP